MHHSFAVKEANHHRFDFLFAHFKMIVFKFLMPPKNLSTIHGFITEHFDHFT